MINYVPKELKFNTRMVKLCISIFLQYTVIGTFTQLNY